MKASQTIAFAAVVLFTMFHSAVVRAENDAEKSFHQLAALEGSWAGKGSQGQAVEVTFRMTAGGSALMASRSISTPRRRSRS